MLRHFLGISRLLAGQLDYLPAIRAVAAEVQQILPHDHLDVCIILINGKYHTAYETGLSTDWGLIDGAPISKGPLRKILIGQADYIMSDDAGVDPVYHFKGSLDGPIFKHSLKSRLSVAMKVNGGVIGAFSCSSKREAVYNEHDLSVGQAVADLLAPYFYALRAAQQAKRSAIIEADAKAREEGLRLGARTLTEQLERERQNIGMDLHDQTLADLTRISRQVERIADSRNVSQEEVAIVGKRLQESMKDLRLIIEQATPSVLQLFGLSQAIEDYLERATRHIEGGLKTRFSDTSGSALEHLNESVVLALFRITQEAINNAVHHAGCQVIQLSIRVDGDFITVHLEDDGRGLPSSVRSQGRGLDNMATRAQLIGAQLSISQAQSGTGTSVVISLEMPKSHVDTNTERRLS
nr:ATP-binding protein [Maritalea myrionectae]